MADRRTRLSSEGDANVNAGTESFSLVVHGPDGPNVEGASNKTVAKRAHVSRTNLTDEEGADDLGNPGDIDSLPTYSHGDRSSSVNQGSGLGEGEDDIGIEPEHGGIGDKAGIILVSVLVVHVDRRWPSVVILHVESRGSTMFSL